MKSTNPSIPSQSPFASVRNVDEDISYLEGVDVLVIWLLTDSWFSSS